MLCRISVSHRSNPANTSYEWIMQIILLLPGNGELEHTHSVPEYIGPFYLMLMYERALRFGSECYISGIYICPQRSTYMIKWESTI